MAQRLIQIPVLRCSTETVNSSDHGERVGNLAAWSRLGATAAWMFQGQWSILGLERVLWPHGIQWVVAWCSASIHRLVHRSAPNDGSAALKISSAPTAAFNICDGGDAIGCAYVAKWTRLGSSCIDVHASAGAYAMVAAPKRSNGPEQCNDVVDWNGSQFFQQSLCFRTTCPLRAAWLFLSAFTRPSLCTGVHELVLFAFVLRFLFTIR